jgi:hypothetical protein
MTGDLNLKIEDRRKATEDRRKATEDRRKSVRDKRKTADEKRLLSGIVWLNARVLGLVLGLIFGLGLFIATNWLVIKGGNPVGPHLELLSQYFIGYRVTFLGSFIGFAYGLAVGTLSGALIGRIYNSIVKFRHRDVVTD